MGQKKGPLGHYQTEKRGLKLPAADASRISPDNAGKDEIQRGQSSRKEQSSACMKASGTSAHLHDYRVSSPIYRLEGKNSKSLSIYLKEIILNQKRLAYC